MARLFFSYSHRDEALRDRLEIGLAMLVRSGVIETWHDRRIPAGGDFAGAIDENLDKADIVLLLVSPDFLASDYCYDIEMKRALERHEKGECVVIPVILRPCDWHAAPFGKLLATPTDGLPVVKHANLDDAFLEVTNAIKGRVNVRHTPTPPSGGARAAALVDGPRSGNLALRKTFSDADRDAFLEASFEFVANYFENSLRELQVRNEGIEGRFKRHDATLFTAVVYRAGSAKARCSVFYGSSMGSPGIGYNNGDSGARNTTNDQLTVQTGVHEMTLASFGFPSSDAKSMTMEGAAEHLWSQFIAPLK